MRKKIIALLMAFTMTFCTTSVVFAVDTGITPLWENIIFITTYFNASGHAEEQGQQPAFPVSGGVQPVPWPSPLPFFFSVLHLLVSVF